MIINYNEQSIVTFMYNNEEWLRKKKKQTVVSQRPQNYSMILSEKKESPTKV